MADGGVLQLQPVLQQLLVGLSRTTILFIVASGMSLVLGVLRIPNLAHGSFYMIGAFLAYTVSAWVGSALGFWVAVLVAPLGVGLLSFLIERGLFRHLYDREHLMLLLFTFSFTLVFSDMVKLIWGSDYRSMPVPQVFQGSLSFLGLSLPAYNAFLLAAGPVVAVGLWALTQKTKIGKIARAAAVDREMVDAIGINVRLVYSIVFVIGCFLAGLGGALVAPTQNITQGMDHGIIMETFLIVIVGGLGNIWGALVGAFVFGLSHAIGIMVFPQFAIVIPYLAVVIILLFRPKGLLKSIW
ncbi:branched-chain amino acid ABC transporter permease [Desulfatirhabdium butyrativorans]|uniref:branched-chain amino acid ABC transporter permease n=1 Tax=Desulfatirhabdium butyrativorans TaxID=340467 RepID=UPI0003F98E94|nr:branched-chain amino acid ABC transporter permease [Desulfatirhabdium butyrativorans]